ncbi:PAS domain-containing protein [Coralloluteibacterium stylophorae]|uniref:PAS domain-containing protein n=1 Tax=Coralloluteibacterium stylophorae TaxID=1776034 RepID=UPI00308448C2
MVRKHIRDLCTFSSHSLIRDPPFSRIDMVSCRNLLIYMDTELQAQVFPVFHYALGHNGVLLLGGSETITRHAELFEPIDKKHRIFRRIDRPSPPLQLASSMVSSTHVPRTPAVAPRPRVGPSGMIARAAGARVLDLYAPPFVVVNADGEILHYSARTGRYLEAAAGAPSNNVLSLARRGLAVELRAALRRAVDNGLGSTREGLVVESEQGTSIIDLLVDPLRGGVETGYLVVFREHELAYGPRKAITADDHGQVVKQLEYEARDLREQLQAATEEYETAVEELKSANEELHSINEEMQSANEELETSKEEMQSMNEELHTVNHELSVKVDEVDRANNDLRNLFESTQVATIFLDRNLIIRAFTPAVVNIYNLIPSDQGRPLTDIVSQIDYELQREDLEHVLGRQLPVERRVARRSGDAHYLMRVLPYRASDNSVDGALVTFVEVTSMIAAERQQTLLVDELNHRVKNMLTVIMALAQQTLRRAGSLEEFGRSFTGRLQGLSTA